jgi:hypothetical protein
MSGGPRVLSGSGCVARKRIDKTFPSAENFRTQHLDTNT